MSLSLELLTWCFSCGFIVLLLVLLWQWFFRLIMVITMSRRIHDPELGRSDSEEDSEQDSEVEIETGVPVKRRFQTRFRRALEQLPPPTKYRSLGGGGGSSSSQGTSIFGGCPICLEDFEEGEACQVIPDCNHIFHLPCIERWLMKRQTCPVCRCSLLPRKRACKFPIPFCW